MQALTLTFLAEWGDRSQAEPRGGLLPLPPPPLRLLLERAASCDTAS